MRGLRCKLIPRDGAHVKSGLPRAPPSNKNGDFLGSLRGSNSNVEVLTLYELTKHRESPERRCASIYLSIAMRFEGDSFSATAPGTSPRTRKSSERPCAGPRLPLRWLQATQRIGRCEGQLSQHDEPTAGKTRINSRLQSSAALPDLRAWFSKTYLAHQRSFLVPAFRQMAQRPMPGN